MLLSLLTHLVNSLGTTTLEGWFMATGLLVRLRPESAGAYPWVPAGVWLAAHRRDGDEGVVWLDSPPVPGDDGALPLFEQHLDVRDAAPPPTSASA
jgi:hypothetical protein